MKRLAWFLWLWTFATKYCLWSRRLCVWAVAIKNQSVISVFWMTEYQLSWWYLKNNFLRCSRERHSHNFLSYKSIVVAYFFNSIKGKKAFKSPLEILFPTSILLYHHFSPVKQHFLTKSKSHRISELGLTRKVILLEFIVLIQNKNKEEKYNIWIYDLKMSEKRLFYEQNLDSHRLRCRSGEGRSGRVLATSRGRFEPKRTWIG